MGYGASGPRMPHAPTSAARRMAELFGPLRAHDQRPRTRHGHRTALHIVHLQRISRHPATSRLRPQSPSRGALYVVTPRAALGGSHETHHRGFIFVHRDGGGTNTEAARVHTKREPIALYWRDPCRPYGWVRFRRKYRRCISRRWARGKTADNVRPI